MTASGFSFGEFELDCADRMLRRKGSPVDVTGRYFDALALLVSERGRLVTKDRFMDEVWRGVPVTDEALTQCIRALRKRLGDDAVRPRYIETVPKHGYRFIAPVDRAADGRDETPAPAGQGWRFPALIAAAGTIGGALAGLVGGIFYGFAAAGGGLGSASTVLVLASMAVLVAAVGAAGVSVGIAASAFRNQRLDEWSVAGGAAGGLAIGAIVKLLALDAFVLLLGQSPGDITGAGEGALLGAAAGLATWMAFRGNRPLSLRFAFVAGALSGGVAGLAIASAGGRLMAASLELVARNFPASRLQLDQLGGLFGEAGFGPISRIAMACLEGAMFGAFLVGAMALAAQQLARRRPASP